MADPTPFLPLGTAARLAQGPGSARATGRPRSAVATLRRLMEPITASRRRLERAAEGDDLAEYDQRLAAYRTDCAELQLAIDDAEREGREGRAASTPELDRTIEDARELVTASPPSRPVAAARLGCEPELLAALPPDEPFPRERLPAYAAAVGEVFARIPRAESRRLLGRIAAANRLADDDPLHRDIRDPLMRRWLRLGTHRAALVRLLASDKRLYQLELETRRAPAPRAD